jgi:hypothetical protein
MQRGAHPTSSVGLDALQNHADRRRPPFRPALPGRHTIGIEAACDLAEASPGVVLGGDALRDAGRHFDLRPTAPTRIRGRAGRRRSAMSRSSSSTGTSRVPHGISIVSVKGGTRRKVARLMPSAAAACVRA